MDEYTFNLISEPWIPCVMPDGKSQEMGLLDTLLKAHDIREVSDTSPLVTASLYRLLLAVLHRNFGPKNAQSWEFIWKTGQFNEQVLTEYFNTWRNRFDLFSEEYPFYQVKKFSGKSKEVKVGLLKQELACGNNATLFDHTNEETLASLIPAEAARCLLAYHSYCLGGLSGLGKNFTDSPTARPVTFLIRGSSLFEILCLNLVRYTDRRPIPCSGNDVPIWENLDHDFNRTLPQGYLDFLTWQGRSFKLIPGTDEQGKTKVFAIKMGLGREMKSEGKLFPLTAWRKNKKDGWVSYRFLEDKALWRNSSVLLQVTKDDNDIPQNIKWLATLVDEEIIDEEIVYKLEALGMGSDQAKISFWRHEQMPLPLVYLKNRDLVTDWLIPAISKTEEGAKALQRAVWTLASDIHLAGDQKEVNNLANHLSPAGLYWSRLEEPFYRHLTKLPEDSEKAHCNWCETIRKTAWEAFDETIGNLDSSARSLKALVHARAVLGGKLKKSLGPKQEEEAHE